MQKQCLGVLALQGGVKEHVEAVQKAAKKLGITVDVVSVRTTKDLTSVAGLIIPGGESTVLYRLLDRENLVDAIKKIPNIFGTCAGAILLAKKIKNAAPGQTTLGLMNITAERNAYGEQSESFEEDIKTKLGNIHAVFIRAPKIISPAPSVNILAKRGNEIIACEEKTNKNYYLATTFHPELTTSVFHEYFIRKVFNK